MYTVNAAYVMRHETSVGFLRAGMAADFVMIDQDIFKLEESNPQQIANTKVLQTVVAGEEVFFSGQL